MVSKIAVIALVAIVAVPIGLGYALNIQDVEYERFAAEGKPINISGLIQNTSEYNYLSADPIAMNTKALYTLNAGSVNSDSQPLEPYSLFVPTVPHYHIRELDRKTSLSGFESYVRSSWTAGIGSTLLFSARVIPGTDISSDQVNATVLGPSNNVIGTYTKVISVYREGSGDVYIQHIYGRNLVSVTIPASTNPQNVQFNFSQYFTGYVHQYWLPIEGAKFIDPTGGFYMDRSGLAIKPPTPAKSVLMTIDLDSTDPAVGKRLFFQPSFSATLTNSASDIIELRKMWFPNNINKWYLVATDPNGNEYYNQELLYNQSGGDNVYQLEINNKGVKALYIGGWPSTYGYANYYKSYEFNYQTEQTGDIHFIRATTGDRVNRTNNDPLIRVDSAEVRSSTSAVIKDQTFNPMTFKNGNPETVMTNIRLIGDSITFAGNTYTASAGGLLVNGEKIPYKKLVFENNQKSDGNYDCVINGITVATLPEPSAITLNGKWSASITIDNQTRETGTESKWIPGGWAWDGVGTSFAVVGLITCVGVFVGLGMYGKRSGAKVGTLMLICAGGALIFLAIM